jgi:hypothetical protein
VPIRGAGSKYRDILSFFISNYILEILASSLLLLASSMRPFTSNPLPYLALLGVLVFSISDSAATGSICTTHECSNDFSDPAASSTEELIYGDEALSWWTRGWRSRTCTPDPSVPCTTAANIRCIEVALYPELKTIRRVCEITKWSDTQEGWIYSEPVNSVSPYAVNAEDFPRIGNIYGYVMRNCVGPTCGDWLPKTTSGEQDSVQFIGVEYACFGSNTAGRCEERCYPGAPKMFSEIPDCY